MIPSQRPYDNLFESFTPLNAKRVDILREVYHIKLIPDPPRPKRVNAVLGNDAKAWCAFHRVKGHHTERRHHLKKEIETLIQRGQLVSYVKEAEGAARKIDPSEREPDSENTSTKKG